MNPPTSSPRINSNTAQPGNFKPADRTLPTRDVSADNIADIYTDFILYCNPNFPLDVDTTTLKTTFQTPPKSDNKDFETYRLFELIRKFDAKEIKTWGQLALDLGVEAPDTSKGQSVQKVQQYSVRLKRWMRAMHIDAFFEFLLGKQHNYFTDIPHPTDPYPSTGRDGVMAEEDLAIRALNPSFRPKRGRRRNSDTERDEENDSEPANKQPRLVDSGTPFSAAPMSSIPLSAHPDSYNDPWAVASAVTPQSFAPWSARPGGPPSAISASNLRWQLGQSGTPSTPHPISAIPTSMSAHIDAAFDGEPKSAVTPSSRRRRKHGPAVSSAWSSNNTPGSKPRGRPPANRNVQDGPYGTFPVEPSNEKSKGQSATPSEGVAGNAFRDNSTPPQVSQAASHPPGEGRPGRLSLQVPPHTGAPVRLATPPTLLVNGETNETGSKSDSDDPSRAMAAVSGTPQTSVASTIPSDNGFSGFSFEALKRVVTSDLLRADIIGRKHRLKGDEAKRLADAVLERIGVAASNSDSPRDSLARITAASWLGLGSQFNVPLGPSAGHGKRIKVTRFCTDADGYEEITFDEEAEDVREVFDIYWAVSQGGCMGSFEMKGLSLAEASNPGQTTETVHDMILRKSVEGILNVQKDGWLEKNMLEVARATRTARGSGGEENVDWKARCKAMEFAAKIAQGEVQRAQQRMIEKIVDAVL